MELVCPIAVTMLLGGQGALFTLVLVHLNILLRPSYQAVNASLLKCPVWVLVMKGIAQLECVLYWVMGNDMSECSLEIAESYLDPVCPIFDIFHS